MSLGSECPIAWNNSKHKPSWQFSLHRRIEETHSLGIICSICPQVVRHPSDHETSPMWKHFQATAQIAKLNEITESEVSEFTSRTMNETALAIRKKQGSQGIAIVSLQMKIIFVS